MNAVAAPAPEKLCYKIQTWHDSKAYYESFPEVKRFLIDSPIKNEQQNQGGEVSRRDIGFLLEGEEDHNHDETRDDVVTLSKQKQTGNKQLHCAYTQTR